MAGKRIATTEINDRNWDREEEPEDAGTFKKASEDVLKTRTIKVAKRRNPIGTLAAAESENKSIFNNLTAFGKSSAESSKTFGFLSNLTKNDDQQKVNGINTSTSISSNQKAEGKSNRYYEKLKGLNESVSKWIKQHVDDNPFLNLTPIFKDYERYLEEIEKLKPDENENRKTTSLENVLEGEKNLTEKTKSDLGTFVFKPPPTEKEENKVPQAQLSATATTASEVKSTLSSASKPAASSVGFSFGFPMIQNANSPTTATSSQSFSFGSSNTQSTPSLSFGVPKSSTLTSGFSFSDSTTFTFTNVQKPQNTESKTVEIDGETESDEPPKNEFKPVVEEGHVYSVRCKVFVKKDNAYADRGVGTLFLKPVPNSEKTQLVVRADTNLGNVLLNFILSGSIPFQRMGKKDVMGVVVPTPNHEPPPVPILLRVKSPEEADKLLKELEKYKM